MDYAAEVGRYTRLAEEAERQITSAQTPEYYRSMAAQYQVLAKNALEQTETDNG